jgi:hypothetical protein
MDDVYAIGGCMTARQSAGRSKEKNGFYIGHASEYDYEFIYRDPTDAIYEEKSLI